nr:hypothetical protein [Tanacetum cinerariifolium]
MTSLDDKAILSGADNHPPMLEKDMYDSWKSRMELYMLNRQHGRMILESVENGPLLWPTVEENGVTRLKKYSELSATEAIQADCDVKATNIILQRLPPEVYALLYDELDKFAYKKEESLRDFYLRFLLLLNDMNIYNMKLEQFQVNTKFLNTLPPEWSKFVIDVKSMDTTIDQQVAMDEALVPHACRLRIRRSNFRLLSDIPSKESTLQLVYDVLRLTPFFKAFLVTADVLEIYMQGLWGTATVHHYFIRLPGQSFVEPPFEEEILAFFWFLGHSGAIRRHTDVEHKDTKKSNEMYYPRFTKVIIHYFMSKDPSIPKRNKMNWHYVRDDHMFSTIKLPKASVRKTRSSSDTTVTPPTAAVGLRLSTSAKGKQPATTSKAKSLSALLEVAIKEAQQLKLAIKRSLQQTHISQASDSGANEGTCSILGVPDVPTDESKEDISWDSTDEEDDDDQEDKGNDEDTQEEDSDDEQASNEEEFIHSSLSTHAEEETIDEESFDPILKTPKNTDDEGNGKENLGMNVGREEGKNEEEEADELYKDVNINLGRGIQLGDVYTTQEFKDSHVTQTPFAGAVSSIPEIVHRYMDQWMNEAVKLAVQLQPVKEQVKVQVSKILPKIEQIMNGQLEAEVLTRSSNSSKTSYVVAADLSKMELKKILIEKIEGNKSIQRSNEQKNLYKALVEAYESDKIILDTYGDTVTLKRRRVMMRIKTKNPSLDQTGGPRDVKKERNQSQQALQGRKLPRELASQHKGLNLDKRADDQPTVEPSQHPEWFSQQKKPLTPDRDWNKTLPATHGSIQPWISELAKQTDSRSSFNELMDTPVDFSAFLINRLIVGTLTPELLAGPTYELMKGSCKSLVELEFFLEERFLKYTTSVTKTKAADYEHIKWIEDLVPRTMWIQEPRRIIAVTELKIVEWHNYKHLDWITVRRDDDKLYKFKEGDFKRLRIQDIEDMHVEDLQLGVESYQKKLNLIRPDTYHSDLKRKEAYIAYLNPRGFIYQNKDKQNRLMRIDELHKFSDGTLTDVRTALDDRLKWIQMKYLPQSIWRKNDKDRAAALIQAIYKMLKTRRIMRSLERFVG